MTNARIKEVQPKHRLSASSPSVIARLPASFADFSKIDCLSAKALGIFDGARKVPLPLSFDNLALISSDYQTDAIYVTLAEALYGAASGANIALLVGLLNEEITAPTNIEYYRSFFLYASEAAGETSPSEEEAEKNWSKFLERLKAGKTQCSPVEAIGSNATVIRAVSHATCLDILVVSQLIREKLLIAFSCPLRTGILLIGELASNQFGFYRPSDNLQPQSQPVVATPAPAVVAQPASSASPASSSSSASATSKSPAAASTSGSGGVRTGLVEQNLSREEREEQRLRKAIQTTESRASQSSGEQSGSGSANRDLTPEEKEEQRIIAAMEKDKSRTAVSSPAAEPIASSASGGATSGAGENWRERRQREEREKAEAEARELEERERKQRAIEEAAEEAQKARDQQASTSWAERTIENPNQQRVQLSPDPRKWSREHVSAWLQERGYSSELRAHFFKENVDGVALLGVEAGSSFLPAANDVLQRLLTDVDELKVGVENIIAMGL